MGKPYIPQYDLSKVAGGAVQQDFDRAIAEVFANMQDPNTPYKPKRSVTIKVGFEQNEQRDDMNVEIVVDKKLVSKSSISTKMAIAKDLKSGKIVAEEYGKQIKGQMSFDDYQQEDEKGTEQDETRQEPDDKGNATNMVPIRKVIGGN